MTPASRMVGPGSHPEDAALGFSPLPREIERFEMPLLPDPQQALALAEGRAVIARLIEAMRLASPDAAQAYPRLPLDSLDGANRQLLNQLLGEGEVSARVRLVDGRWLELQESVFAGVWRVLESASDGSLLHDRIEACPIPAEVWQVPRDAGCRQPVLPDVMDPALMNAPAVVSEIVARMQQYHEGDATHVINFSLLPMNQADLACINALLGSGVSGVFSRGYGKCRVLSTSLRYVWRVQYFNDMNGLLLDTVEITTIPEVALASADDLADSLVRLEEALAWLEAG
jgi:hydrogenase-1 operon protein HyaF